jgi:predicted neuraminidase
MSVNSRIKPVFPWCLFLIMAVGDGDVLLNDASGQNKSPAGLIRSQFIYEKASYPECHASTLAECAEGLVAAWFGGTREKHPDVGIWFSRLLEGRWTAPVEVANGVQHTAKRYPCWNPVLFQPRDGQLMLFYKVGPNPDKWWGVLRTSSDAGRTWSDPQRLPEDILGPVKNKPVQLANGDLLCPSSSEHDGWQVHFERSLDLGKTWTLIGPINDGRAMRAIQPSLLFHGNSRWQALGRTANGRIFETWSDDDGRTWSPLALTSLPNPNAGTDAVTLRDGRHLLVYNHTSRGRSPLNVAVSRDGRLWEAAVRLENEPGSEFSYPAVIQTRNGLVHISYTWKRQRIKHAVIDPAQLASREIANGRWPE